VSGGLTRGGSERSKDDNAVVELILTLLRNVLAVPAPAVSMAGGATHMEGMVACCRFAGG
jgi:hypothetical protein